MVCVRYHNGVYALPQWCVCVTAMVCVCYRNGVCVLPQWCVCVSATVSPGWGEVVLDVM